MTSFTNLGLAEPIVRAISDARLVTPTPIQAQAIPEILAGRDLIGIAQTGTGKTAAFALPILDRLVRHKHKLAPKSVRALVLSPTRELSGQIVESFERFGRHAGIKVALAIGGVPMGRQIRALSQGVDILVATPGRLIDLSESNAVRLDEVEVFVLDEADQMLDMGFIHAIRAIVRRLPHKRHSLFFSATMPAAIAELSNTLLHAPVTVAVTPVAKTADKVEQRVVLVDKAKKTDLLAEVLSKEEIDRALVFTRTKHGADRVVRALAKVGIRAEAIHGNKSQGQRDRVLLAFREGKVRTLVATDIAARGIDVTGVSHVVNFDLPNVPESYVHRIGRTARAGRDGIAISFCDQEERAYLRSIERLIKMQIEVSDRRGAKADFQVPAGAPLPEPERELARETRGPGRSGQQRGRRPEGAERREPREARNPEAQKDARKPRPHNGQGGRPEDGRGEAGANGAGRGGRRGQRPAANRQDGRHQDNRHQDNRQEKAGHGTPRGEGRQGRSERSPSGGKEIGAIGFMRSVPERSSRPPAKRPAR